MTRFRIGLLAGISLPVAGVIAACSAFPAMTIQPADLNQPNAGAPLTEMIGGRGPTGQAAQTGGGLASNTPMLIPGGPSNTAAPAPGRAGAAVASQATEAQINALVDAGPVNATIPAQPLTQYLATALGDVLRVPYSLGPNVGLRTEVVAYNVPASTTKQAYLRGLVTYLQSMGLTASVNAAGGLYIAETGDTGNFQQIQGWAVVRGRSTANTPLAQRQVAQFFPLVAIQASALQTMLQSMAPSGVTQITVDTEANAVLIQGTGQGVANAVTLLRNLDKPGFAGGQVMRVAPAYWPADTFGATLANVLSTQGFVVSYDTPAAPKGIQIMTLGTTGQLLIFAADLETMNEIRNWIAQLDTPAQAPDQTTTFVYEVQSTSATTLGATISASLTAARTGAVTNAAVNTAQTLAQVLAGGRAGAVAQPAAQAAQAGRAGAAATAAAGRAGVATAGRAGTATTTAAGGVLTVDTAGNRLIFNGAPAEWNQIRMLLRQLDTPVRQVVINLTFAEVTLTDQTRLGVEWFLNQGSFGGTVSGGTGGITSGGTGGGNLSLATAGAVFNFIRGPATAPDVRASFEAFASNNKVNVLLNPKLTASNGQESRLAVGDSVPYIASTTPATATSGAVSNFQRQDTGVTVTFTPQIYGNDRVDLTIQTDVLSVKESTNPAIPTPTFPTRSIATTLSLASGKTGVLGGLMSDSFSKGNSGVPLLKDVPILGNIFRTDTVDGSKTALLMLVTPVIVTGVDEMGEISNRMAEEVNSVFRLGAGPSYTLTGFPGAFSVGVNVPPRDIAVNTQSLILPPRAPAAMVQPAPAPPPSPPPPPEPAAPGAPGAGRGGGRAGGAPPTAP